MDEKIEMLLCGQHYKKFQEAVYSSIMNQYQISLLDLRVLLFLSEHENNNTAKDIVEMHHFTKSNVSRSIESLLEKGYLLRRQDNHDRRCIHLQLLPEAYRIIDSARQKKESMKKILFQGITEQEVKVIAEVSMKISHNIAKAMEHDL